MVITAKGVMVRQKVKDIPSQGRAATGVLVHARARCPQRSPSTSPRQAPWPWRRTWRLPLEVAQLLLDCDLVREVVLVLAQLMRDRGAQLEGHHAGLSAVDVPQRAGEQLQPPDVLHRFGGDVPLCLAEQLAALAELESDRRGDRDERTLQRVDLRDERAAGDLG